MILFVFEGVKREPDLFRTIQRLYFANRDEQIVCSYNNNIYQLYKDLQEYDGDGDIVSLLMEKFAGQADNPLKDIDASADISEIYLFFDYDFHNRNLSLEEINRQVKEMLETFNNETEFGRLYIDYPMVESIRYTKQLPDANYWTYSVTRSECGKFKGVSADFSAYDSFDFILLKDHREPTEEETKEIKQNWEYLKEMNDDTCFLKLSSRGRAGKIFQKSFPPAYVREFLRNPCHQCHPSFLSKLLSYRNQVI